MGDEISEHTVDLRRGGYSASDIGLRDGKLLRGFAIRIEPVK